MMNGSAAKVKPDWMSDGRSSSGVYKTEPRLEPIGLEDEFGHPDTEQALGTSIFQFIGSSLEGGPRGIHPATHIVALAAIAGYSARISVALKASRGETDDDFRRISINRTTSVIASEQVNCLVLGMDKPSFAGIVVGFALRCGLLQVPDMNALLQGHLSAAGTNQQSWTDCKSDVPPESLLMMYWEQVARFFRNTPRGIDLAPMAAAHASGEAISVYREAIPVDQSLHLALNTAIAMSKIDRSF